MARKAVRREERGQRTRASTAQSQPNAHGSAGNDRMEPPPHGPSGLPGRSGVLERNRELRPVR